MIAKKNTPNALTWLRFCLTLGLLVLVFTPHNVVLAQFFMLAGIVSDKLDGSLARLWNVESERGKKMESLVDPLFLTVAGIYLLMHRDLPLWFFLFALILAVTGNLLRLITTMKARKLFYKKSPLTRIGVGIGYLLMLWYLFALPSPEILLYPAAFFGLVVALNYLHLMINSSGAGLTYAHRNQKRHKE